MDIIEYRKRVLKNFSKFFRALIFLRIASVKIIDHGEGRMKGNRYSYRKRELNWWNPFSYLIALFLLVLVFGRFFFSDLIGEIKSAFRWT